MESILAIDFILMSESPPFINTDHCVLVQMLDVIQVSQKIIFSPIVTVDVNVIFHNVIIRISQTIKTGIVSKVDSLDFVGKCTSIHEHCR